MVLPHVLSSSSYSSPSSNKSFKRPTPLQRLCEVVSTVHLLVMAALFPSSPSGTPSSWPSIPSPLSADGALVANDSFYWPAPSLDSSSRSSADSSSDSSASVGSNSPLLFAPSPTILQPSPSPYAVASGSDWRAFQGEAIPWSWADARATGLSPRASASVSASATPVHSNVTYLAGAAGEEQPVSAADEDHAVVVRRPPAVQQLRVEDSEEAEEEASGRAPPASSKAAAAPRFYTRKVACQVCHFAKVRCDGGRPCTRCSRLQLTQHCVNRPTSRRGARDKSTDSSDSASASKRRLLSSSSAAQQQRWLEEATAEPTPSRTRLAGASPSSAFSVDSASPSSSLIDSSLSVPPALPRPLRVSLLLRVDASNVSSSLLASHFRTVTHYLRKTGSVFPPTRNPLRDKLIQHSWFTHNLTPTDREVVAHAFVHWRGGRWYEGYFDQRLSGLFDAAASKLAVAGLPSSSTLLLTSVSDDTHDHPQCNGQPCSGYCPYVRSLVRAAPCSYCWEESPDMPIPDQPGFPSHAFLCIRHQPEDVAVADRQQHILSLRAAMVAQQLLADASQGITDEEWTMEESALDSDIRHPDGPAQLLDPLDCSPPPPPALATSQLAPSPSDAALDATAPDPTIRVSMAAQVNREFERLLGYSQAEVRASFLQWGEKAMYGLLRPEDWPEVMDLNREAKMMKRTDFRARCTAITRTQQEVPCVLSGSYQHNGDGMVIATFLSFLPLPDAISGRRRYESAVYPTALT